MQKRLKAALWASLSIWWAAAGWAATATSNVTVNESAWTDLGVGPLQIVAFKSGPASYAISDVSPTIGGTQGFPIPIDHPLVVNTVTHVWARATTSVATTVTFAPIMAGGIAAGVTTTNIPVGQFLMSAGPTVQGSTVMNGVPAVSCSGAPTAAFAAVNGLVTAC